MSLKTLYIQFFFFKSIFYNFGRFDCDQVCHLEKIKIPMKRSSLLSKMMTLWMIQQKMSSLLSKILKRFMWIVDSRDNEDSHEKEFLALKDDDSVDDSKEMKN